MYNNEFRDLFGDVGRVVSTREVGGGVLQLADATEVRSETNSAMTAHIFRADPTAPPHTLEFTVSGYFVCSKVCSTADKKDNKQSEQ